MLNLLYKEFVQMRMNLLPVVASLVLVLVFGKTLPEFSVTFMYTLPIVLSMIVPQMVFEQEERWNTFAFLRSLPIPPGAIVAAKYLVSATVTMAFLATIAVAGAMGILPQRGLMMTVSIVGLISLVLGGVSLFLHFWLGLKSAKIALVLLVFALLVLPIGLGSREAGGIGAMLKSRFAWFEALAQTPLGVCVALAIGLLAFGASYLASAALFSKRDLGRMP